MSRPKLGEMLVQAGLLTKKQLTDVLHRTDAKTMRLGEYLTSRGLC